MKKVPIDYRVGDPADNGEEIVAIISQSHDLVVYLTHSGKPGFESEPYLLDEHRRTIAAHDRFVRLISIGLRGKARLLAFEQLGYATNMALRSTSDEPKHFYQEFEVSLRPMLIQMGRIAGLAGTLIIGSLLPVVALVLGSLEVLPPGLPQNLLAGFAGATLVLLAAPNQNDENLEALAKPIHVHCILPVRGLAVAGLSAAVTFFFARALGFAPNGLSVPGIVLSFILGIVGVVVLIIGHDR